MGYKFAKARYAIFGSIYKDALLATGIDPETTDKIIQEAFFDKIEPLYRDMPRSRSYPFEMLSFVFAWSKS